MAPPSARLVRTLALAGVLVVTGGCDTSGVSGTHPSGGATTTAPGGPSGHVEPAQVVRVVDGDTIVVTIAGREDRVRYIGIDAPESVRPNAPVEPYAREAAQANAALVDGRPVLLERDVSDRDQFGRLLRYVWVDHGSMTTFVNLELVERGLATTVVFPPDVRHVDLFRAAERRARSDRRGVWSASASP